MPQVEERVHKIRGVDELGLKMKLRLRLSMLQNIALNTTTP
jgi:hypothetical protein